MELLALSAPKDAPGAATSSKQIIALSTRSTIDVSTHVYPVIRSLQDVQFQELEEIIKSLKTASTALKATLDELKAKERKFAL